MKWLGTALSSQICRCVSALVIALLTVASAHSHEVRPAYLSVEEKMPGEFSVLFKTPMQGDARLALAALFSGRVEALTPVVSRQTGDAMVQTWHMRTVEPLSGQNVLIDGLQNSMTDALVHVMLANGNTWTTRLTPNEPSAAIPAAQSRWTVFAVYVRHGIEHIAFGFDHLLFVAALMLIVRDWRKLVKAVTAFTAAHSITLTSATLGWVTLPSAPVETMIAISIVLVAAEVVRMERGQLSLAITSPWLVAFAFGLLHGFGFAGALVELGLPRNDIPLALLAFNVGVELGQLAFIAVILTAVYSVRRIVAIPRRAIIGSAYAIGIIAAFWSVQRLDAMFSQF
ncbi:HupE/UreJ family protein [Rhizobium sp. WYCCWR 11146]|uniref:HupE/UreJ family protein n=1 Tax=Rhizobium sp. WYCCWR 11146 TaxID=2749833 RepID=UPI0015E6E0A3|nr:HupE/UreJ family protein [Rhizobium sp. WYCCWR 11146]MBA1345425.1 HupE/UreJ family protein [Rhizobium sp. WYCCWR 11146]